MQVPHAERFVRTIKHECLNRLVLFGRGALDRAISAFLLHYNRERNHQGLGNELISADKVAGQNTGEVVRRERLGGLLSLYHRAAA